MLLSGPLVAQRRFAIEQTGERTKLFAEKPEMARKWTGPVRPPVNGAPEAWRAVDQREVTIPCDAVEAGRREGEQIGDLCGAGAAGGIHRGGEIAGGGVVPFAKAGGEDEHAPHGAGGCGQAWPRPAKRLPG